MIANCTDPVQSCSIIIDHMLEAKLHLDYMNLIFPRVHLFSFVSSKHSQTPTSSQDKQVAGCSATRVSVNGLLYFGSVGLQLREGLAIICYYQIESICRKQLLLLVQSPRVVTVQAFRDNFT